MPLPLLGLASGLFGGGSTAAASSGAAAGPVTQTTGPISLGSKFLGRGSVTSSDTSASGSASVAAPAAPAVNNGPLYAALGVGVLALVLVLATRKGGG